MVYDSEYICGEYYGGWGCAYQLGPPQMMEAVYYLTSLAGVGRSPFDWCPKHMPPDITPGTHAYPQYAQEPSPPPSDPQPPHARPYYSPTSCPSPLGPHPRRRRPAGPRTGPEEIRHNVAAPPSQPVAGTTPPPENHVRYVYYTGLPTQPVAVVASPPPGHHVVVYPSGYYTAVVPVMPVVVSHPHPCQPSHGWGYLGPVRGRHWQARWAEPPGHPEDAGQNGRGADTGQPEENEETEEDELFQKLGNIMQQIETIQASTAELRRRSASARARHVAGRQAESEAPPTGAGLVYDDDGCEGLMRRALRDLADLRAVVAAESEADREAEREDENDIEIWSECWTPADGTESEPGPCGAGDDEILDELLERSYHSS